MPNDAIDRSVFLARSGKPHNPQIAHLTETHSLPGQMPLEVTVRDAAGNVVAELRR